MTSWLTLRDVLDLCDFVTHSCGTVMIGIFACFRDLWMCDIMVDTIMTSKQSTILWTSTLWLRNYNLEFWFYVVWDQTGRNRYFPMPCVQVASFEQSRLVFHRQMWSCWNQFLANRIRDLFCFEQTRTKIVWTAVWTELLQFESVNVCFLWSCAGGDFTALLDVVLSPNDDTCQSIQVASSYVLLTVMRDWRLKGTNTSIGCVLSASCLWKKKWKENGNSFWN